MMTVYGSKDQTAKEILDENYDGTNGKAYVDDASCGKYQRAHHGQCHSVVSYGPKAMLRTVALDTLKPVAGGRIQDTFLTGSHIYNWSSEMTEILYPGPLA